MILRVPLESDARLQVGTLLLLWPHDPGAAITRLLILPSLCDGVRIKGHR